MLTTKSRHLEEKNSVIQENKFVRLIYIDDYALIKHQAVVKECNSHMRAVVDAIFWLSYVRPNYFETF